MKRSSTVRPAPASRTTTERLPHPGAARGRRVAAAAAREDERAVERLSRTFRALGDPTRSRMVLALSRGELCVGELAERVGLSLSATSHQLRILRELDLVRVRRAGKNQVYALNETGFGFCSPRSCQAWRQVLSPDGPGR